MGSGIRNVIYYTYPPNGMGYGTGGCAGYETYDKITSTTTPTTYTYTLYNSATFYVNPSNSNSNPVLRKYNGGPGGAGAVMIFLHPSA
jgi:hypothetical protein